MRQVEVRELLRAQAPGAAFHEIVGTDDDDGISGGGHGEPLFCRAARLPFRIGQPANLTYLGFRVRGRSVLLTPAGLALLTPESYSITQSLVNDNPPQALGFCAALGYTTGMPRKSRFATFGRQGGKVGGRSRSPAKATASRENGKLGGRPRKHPKAKG